MEKKKIKLADLKPGIPIDPVPFQKNPCETIKNEVNEFLIAQCTKKVNKLKKCTKCEIDHKDWPIINSTMDTRYLNTAFDGVNGRLDPTNLNNGQLDLHWMVGLGDTSGPASVTNWIPAFVYRNSVAWQESPFSNANWISLYSDGHHDGNIDVYFRYQFYLDSGIDLSQFALNMDFYADNSVHEIYINQIKQSTHSPSLLPQAPSNEYQYVGFQNGDQNKNQVHISLANDWKHCANEIIVHVKSGASYIGFLAQNSLNCYEAKFPNLTPTINVTWGDSNCDCIETDDTEIMCITVCNGYSNVIFKNLVIGRIRVVDENGNPVPILPDGTPSVGLHPIGPYCFGDIAACSPGVNNCVSREFVLINRGAKSGKYKILLEGICFEVCNRYALNDCFEFFECSS
jgi:hypothetical protein